MFSQTAEGIRSLYAGITEEEWETSKSILSEDEMNTVNGLLAGAGCIDAPQTDDNAQTAEENDTAQIAAEDGAGIELMSIDDSAVTTDKKEVLKSYLAAHAGTYVTEKSYTDANGNKCAGNEWKIEISADGTDEREAIDNIEKYLSSKA